MRTLSKWAYLNPIKSRFLITFLHLLSIVNAIFLGVLFYLGDIPSSIIPTVLLTTIFFTSLLLYPNTKRRLTGQKYQQQKLCDFTLVLSGALFLAFAVNHYLATPSDSYSALAENTQVTVQLSAIGQSSDTDVMPVLTKAEIRKARRGKIKELKTSIRAWKKAHKGNKKGGDAGEVLLILLVIFGAAMAALLLAALSCSLACSGAGGLAILLMLAGIVGIVFLSVVLIKGIVGASGPPARPVKHG
jgi:hypothetical protein